MPEPAPHSVWAENPVDSEAVWLKFPSQLPLLGVLGNGSGVVADAVPRRPLTAGLPARNPLAYCTKGGRVAWSVLGPVLGTAAGSSPPLVAQPGRKTLNPKLVERAAQVVVCRCATCTERARAANVHQLEMSPTEFEKHAGAPGTAPCLPSSLAWRVETPARAPISPCLNRCAQPDALLPTACAHSQVC